MFLCDFNNGGILAERRARGSERRVGLRLNTFFLEECDEFVLWVVHMQFELVHSGLDLCIRKYLSELELGEVGYTDVLGTRTKVS